MAESIAQKYRARFPPKEHEEAVRMLLEGVEKEKVEETLNNRRRGTRLANDTDNKQRRTMLSTERSANRTTTSANRRADTSSLEDRKSLNSAITTETNSSGIVECSNTDSQSAESGGNGLASMQSKSTSTSDSVSLAGGIDSERLMGLSDAASVQSGDLIPSRTIAVQCDLKWSSVKTRDVLFDTSMQASSISSTRYGFYNFNHETLAKRHRLQRSTSYRDLANENYHDEADRSTTTVASIRGKQQFSHEAPTSMSEMSELEASGDDRENNHRRPLSNNQTFAQSYNRPTAEEAYKARPNTRELQQVSRLSARGRQMYGSTVDNSSLKTARARVDSLPRRPRTALSYVSTSKLRHQQQHQSGDDESSDPESFAEQRKAERPSIRSSLARDRNALSHTNLAPRPKTPAPSAENTTHPMSSVSNASSDSELTCSLNRPRMDDRRRRRRRQQRSGHHESREENQNQSEEMILVSTKANTTTTTSGNGGAGRPQLVAARHEEEVHDLNDMMEQFRQAESELRNNNTGYKHKSSTLRPTTVAATAVVDDDDDVRQRRRLDVGSTMSLQRKRTSSRKSQLNPRDDYDDDEDDDHDYEHQTLQRRGQQLTDFEPIEKSDKYSSLAMAAHKRSPIQVGRSTSMRQTSSNGSRPSTLVRRPSRPDDEDRQHRHHHQGTIGSRAATNNTLTRNRSHTLKHHQASSLATSNGLNNRDSSRFVNADDSDALESKNWLNPAAIAQKVSAQNGRTTAIASSDESSDQALAARQHVEGGAGGERLAFAATTNSNSNSSSGGGLASQQRRTGAFRSMSMRDVNVESARYGANYARGDSGYTPYRANTNFTAKYNDEYSSSESSDLVVNENAVRNLAARLSPLDFDSQQRLNESGLPEVGAAADHSLRMPSRASYLEPRVSYQHHHHASQDNLQQSRYLSSSSGLNGQSRSSGGRHAIRGRALSQQSLTRPTMPAVSIASGRRRWQATGSTNSASSDVGGSSMSLATRLQGRYESAHTRTPIVMYIPPASSAASSLKGDDSLLGATASSRLQRSTLKKGSRSPRSRSRHCSQDRSLTLGRRQRSTSRNGSDSETSSILKSLVRSRGSKSGAESAYSSKRFARMQNMPINNILDSDDENMDGVGRLATEMDSYKFIRRYSVPKDAKINWFARLRQRVAPGNR